MQAALTYSEKEGTLTRAKNKLSLSSVQPGKAASAQSPFWRLWITYNNCLGKHSKQKGICEEDREGSLP